MKSVEDELLEDQMAFGGYALKHVPLDSWRKRIWGAIKVLTGEAGLLFIRIPPEKIYEE